MFEKFCFENSVFYEKIKLNLYNRECQVEFKFQKHQLKEILYNLAVPTNRISLSPQNPHVLINKINSIWIESRHIPKDEWGTSIYIQFKAHNTTYYRKRTQSMHFRLIICPSSINAPSGRDYKSHKKNIHLVSLFSVATYFFLFRIDFVIRFFYSAFFKLVKK